MGFSSARNLGRDISAGFSPPRRMPISEAVKKFMRVPKGAGNSVPWDPELTPYIIEPMNCLASREYDAVIFVGPARTGKTIGLIDGWIVYTIVCDPSDMLVVQMTEDKAREHSKKRLDRTFRSSAAVKKRMSPRRNDNNVHDKTFRDGSFLKIGWPSVNIMSSSDYRFVALTDYDRFPENIDSEGDGFSLASKRTTTFMSAGMTLVESSPGRDICDSKWRRKSPHEAPPTTGILSLYNRGDRRRWYWPCPHCGEYFQPAMDAMTATVMNRIPLKPVRRRIYFARTAAALSLRRKSVSSIVQESGCVKVRSLIVTATFPVNRAAPVSPVSGWKGQLLRIRPGRNWFTNY